MKTLPVREIVFTDISNLHMLFKQLESGARTCDAIVVNPWAEGSPFTVFEGDDMMAIFEKFLYSNN